MNLLFYTRAFPPDVGGIERFTEILLRGVSTSGVKVRVILEPFGEGSRKRFDPIPGVSLDLSPSLFRKRELLTSSDCIHLNGPALSILPLALSSKKPIVITHHGLQAVCPRGDYWNTLEGRICPGYFLKGRWDRCFQCLGRNTPWRTKGGSLISSAIRRRILHHPSITHAVPSHFLREALDLPKPILIPHGIPLPPPLLWKKEREIRLLFAGRLVQEKNPAFCLEVLRCLLEKGYRARLIFAGSGPLREDLERKGEDMGVRHALRFLGAVPPERMVEHYASSHFVLIPSQCAEAFGLTPLEAILGNRPVLASPYGALKEIVPHPWCLEPEDPTAWSALILSLWREPERFLPLLTERSQEYRKRFSAERMVEEYLQLYQKVLDPPSEKR